MKKRKKRISVDALRFIVKALYWAKQDRDALADAHCDDRLIKATEKEAEACARLSEEINAHLKSGGKGLVNIVDEILGTMGTHSMLTLPEIKEWHRRAIK